MFLTLTDSKLIREDFGFSEMDRGKIFQRLLRNNLADILTLLVTMTRKWPRPVHAQTDFDQIWADFQQHGRYFPPPETLH